MVFTIVLLGVLISAQTHSAATVIVAIGDAITNGTGASSSGGWVTQLRNKLQRDFPDKYEVQNKGINGDTAQGVFNRLTRDVISYQPSIVIVGIGTNDAYGHDGINPPAINAEDYRTVMNSIFDELKQKLPMTPVFVMGMTTPLKEYMERSGYGWVVDQFDQESLDAQFKKYNDVLKELTEEYGHFYVDIPAQWPQNVEQSWELVPDGIHPNDEGYRKMADILYTALTSTASVEFHYKLVVTWGGLRDL